MPRRGKNQKTLDLAVCDLLKDVGEDFAMAIPLVATRNMGDEITKRVVSLYLNSVNPFDCLLAQSRAELIASGFQLP